MADPRAPEARYPEGLAALAHQAIEVEGPVRAAFDLMDWHYSGLSDGRIRPEIALRMMTTEVIGPDGMFDHPTVRIGLFAQSADVAYVTRKHAAEETFIMLGGAGDWQKGDEPVRGCVVGDVIHHPPMVPHSSRTHDRPLIALWRWTGDISYRAYELTG